MRAFASIPSHCSNCLKALWSGAAYQRLEVAGGRGKGVGLAEAQAWGKPPSYLNGTIAPIHLVIHQLNAVLHALWGQQFGLAHDSWKHKAGDRGCSEGLCEGIPTPNRILFSPNSRSMTVGAAVPMPRFWIWYTGCVGLCPSFSPLGGAGAAGGGAAVPSGVETFVVAAGPFPSSRGFMRTMGFSRGAGAGGAAGAVGGGGCFDYGSEKVSVSERDPLLP